MVVSQHNFPEIAAQIEEIRERLGYPKSVRAFVTQDGEISAFLWRTFGRRYMAFNSGLVEDLTFQEREFVIGRFVGALRARHMRFHEAASFIEGFENLAVLNLLVLPYLRASVLSGDRIGLMICGSYDVAVRALDKLLLGNKLGPKLSTKGILEQGREVRANLFGFISIMFSSHPHMTDRYADMVSFAREQGFAVNG